MSGLIAVNGNEVSLPRTSQQRTALLARFAVPSPVTSAQTAIAANAPQSQSNSPQLTQTVAILATPGHSSLPIPATSVQIPVPATALPQSLPQATTAHNVGMGAFQPWASAPNGALFPPTRASLLASSPTPSRYPTIDRMKRNWGTYTPFQKFWRKAFYLGLLAIGALIAAFALGVALTSFAGYFILGFVALCALLMLVSYVVYLVDDKETSGLKKFGNLFVGLGAFAFAAIVGIWLAITARCGCGSCCCGDIADEIFCCETNGTISPRQQSRAALQVQAMSAS